MQFPADILFHKREVVCFSYKSQKPQSTIRVIWIGIILSQAKQKILPDSRIDSIKREALVGIVDFCIIAPCKHGY